MLKLMDMLGQAAPDIKTIDVGAMYLDDSGMAFKKLMRPGKGSVIGFEPVQAECDKLNAMNLKGHTYLPYFIGDGSEGTFHLCNYPMTSSLYEPNRRLLDIFNNLGELTMTVETSKAQTKRLDDIPECANADYIKIDVQGAELGVLRGAVNVLKHAVVVEAEAEFVPMYKDQPLFGDVDAFMRAHGFLLHGLSGPAGRAFRPLVFNNNPSDKVNQVLWTDGIWVKDFTRFSILSPEELLKLAVIVNDMYNSIDLAAYALQFYDAKTNKGLWEVVMRRLFGGKLPPKAPMFD